MDVATGYVFHLGVSKVANRKTHFLTNTYKTRENYMIMINTKFYFFCVKC